MEFLAGSEKRFFDFISNLTDKDKIALLSHNDGDGIVSALIASKVLGKIECIKFLAYQPKMLEPIVKDLKKLKINKIVMTDLMIENESDVIKQLEKFADILIIDHHKIVKDLNSEKTVFIKADSLYPASYMCYYLFSKVQKIPNRLVALGILSDMVPWKYTKENAEQVFDDFNLKEKTNLFKEVIILGSALVYFRNKEKEVFNILAESGLDGLTKLKKYAKIIEEELNRYIKDFDKNKEEHKDLILYYFEPKYQIASMLINEISAKIRDKTCIFVTKKEGFLGISARRQDGKIDCPKLLKEATKDTPNSNAGGHHNAAGGTIPLKYLEQFKKSLFKAYDSLV